MIRRVLAILFFTLLPACPAVAWEISSYDVLVNVLPDSGVDIRETITANFSGDPHHGIYRDIPVAGKDRYGNAYRLRVDNLRVTDEDGTQMQSRVEFIRNGLMHIVIGSADSYISGKQVYNIRYHIYRGIHFFPEHDELYFNAIGHEWSVPIQSASCVVVLPKQVMNGVRTAAYTGYYGSTTSEISSDTSDARTARFWMRRSLNPGEGITVVVGWPKGIVHQPPLSKEAGWFIRDNSYFFLPPFFLIGLVLMWRRLGRDPEINASEMVCYEPPDRLSPAELGTLIDEQVDMRDISASIIDLAVRGYIKIEAETLKIGLRPKTEYTLRLTRPYDDVIADGRLSEYDHEVIRGLFRQSDWCYVPMLRHSFYIHLAKLKNLLYDGLVESSYFAFRPDSVRQNYRSAGMIVAGVGIAGAMASLVVPELSMYLPLGWAFAVAVCGTMLAIAAKAMPRKTKKGKEALIRAKGFEEYLLRAEANEIEFQERQNIFEKFLPYAMAFGIADKWARAFEGMQVAPPQWYTGDYDGVFHPTVFVHDLSYATDDWSSAMTSTPRTSGSSYGGSGGSDGDSFFGGGSGFGDFGGGGGFSGGGFGGGGGGAW